eukprot:CAMPEP_0178503984 /NCGR_PEP_ID=MMETSP0696-20121128/18342_1 /TAXON_ID=265572 /ORGANISM="Extubocellulus spinifer, Strain CCMP396" /LENGTH=406 /DNA_ID=CAMNT_0020133171 /DNA_START=312 /DNA_END=1529 /DNA_ORIENTATION=-
MPLSVQLRLEAGDYLDEVANAPNGTYDEELFASLLSPEQNGDSVPSIPTRKNASLSPTHDTADFCKVVPPQIPSVALPLVAQSQSPSAPASVGDIEAVKPIDGLRDKLKEMRIKNKRWGEEIQSPSFFPSSRRAMISESKKGGETIRNPSFPSSSLVRSPCANQGGDNGADTPDEDSDSASVSLPESVKNPSDDLKHALVLLKKQKKVERVNRRKVFAELSFTKKESILGIPSVSQASLSPVTCPPLPPPPPSVGDIHSSTGRAAMLRILRIRKTAHAQLNKGKHIANPTPLPVRTAGATTAHDPENHILLATVPNSSFPPSSLVRPLPKRAKNLQLNAVATFEAVAPLKAQLEKQDEERAARLKKQEEDHAVQLEMCKDEADATLKDRIRIEEDLKKKIRALQEG